MRPDDLSSMPRVGVTEEKTTDFTGLPLTCVYDCDYMSPLCQKKMSASLELVASHLARVLRTELQSSGRAAKFS